ncbi:MAG: deoxyribose-phosphate aldolase [Ruminococcaceae bacterium]|nr:deoxyribose-phosphate aldolase [Oscillospiraceae bacterium]
MDIREILSRVDHTLLKTTATWDEIKEVCDDALKYKTASVCVPPSFVRQCAEYLKGKIPVCTVVGFPNGYTTTVMKCAEAYDAVQNGADEIDMVINLGWVKEGKYDDILSEINDVKGHCCGKILKVIIEACDLTEDEKHKVAEIVDSSNADYIKTSTGFSKDGATYRDVIIFKLHIKGRLKIKAAGGISSIKDAEEFIGLGADRIGTSKIVNIVKSEGLL